MSSQHVLAVVASVTIYMLSGPSLIFVNRALMKEYKFTYPLLISALGQVCSALFCRILVAGGFASISPANSKLAHDRKFIMSALLPVGACQAITLCCGNLIYNYLNVGFIQMLKSFTPVVVLMMLQLTGVESITVNIAVATAGIAIGTLISSLGEVDATWTGLLLFGGSSLSEALRVVVIQSVLQNRKFSVVEGMYYMAPVAASWLIVAAALIEVPVLINTGDYQIIREQAHFFVLAGALAIVLNFASFWVVKVTSGIILKVLGTVRTICIILYGVYMYGEALSLMSTVGYSITLFSFAAYTRIKLQER